ncbi:MAG: HAD family hydrolase [Caldilineaceae bacterium]
MAQIAAIDMDDTLLRTDGTISPRTVGSLQRWLRTGRRLVIATGRPPRSIGRSLPDELQRIPWICYNGAEIRIGDEVIYRNLIPATAVREIVTQIQTEAPTALIGVEIDNVLHLNRVAKRTTPYTVTDLLTLDQPAAKVLLLSESGEPLARLACVLPECTRAMYSLRYPHAIQILAQFADKAEALTNLVADWGVTLADVVALGDDVNDVEMVRLCGVGVAVANAVDEVKAVADEVTYSNDEDGVAATLEKLLG